MSFLSRRRTLAAKRRKRRIPFRPGKRIAVGLLLAGSALAVSLTAGGGSPQASVSSLWLPDFLRELGESRVAPLAELAGDACIVVAPKEIQEQPDAPVGEALSESLQPEPVETLTEGVIASGCTLSGLLCNYLSPAEIHNFARTCDVVFPPSKLRAGRPYSVRLLDGEFDRFEYEIDDEMKLIVRKEGDGFTSSLEAIPYDIEIELVEGSIESSLFGAVDAAGESPALAVRLSEIFAWDVDFVRDIRTGDSFKAIVEKKYREGRFTGYGEITAAGFVNQGQAFEGFLFMDDDGREQYYDAEGKSLRKAFLKAPLSFTRISSGFSMNRLHPILKIRRPHPGIDYAAPVGTPVRTVGDGVVVAKAYSRGAGNYIKVRHNSVYETTYMHLKGFARGMKKGARVSQGQVIAYVGSTGLSTGPHLDFRMKKNGGYINPRKVKSPPTAPVPKELMADFERHIAPLQAMLAVAGGIKVAESP